MDEIWKDVKGFSGYQVSNTGRVRSCIRGGRYGTQYCEEWHEVIPYKYGYKNRYLRVNLYKDGQMFSISVHQLVAENFIENSDNKPFVCHKDDNPHNNSVNNLYYGSPKDNTSDAIRNGHLQNMWKATSECLRKPVHVEYWDQLHEKLLNVYDFKSITEASSFLNISSGTISEGYNNPHGREICKNGYFYDITRGEK